MALNKTQKIWHNGKMINWDDAKIHVISHVVSYASSVFEGHSLLPNARMGRPSFASKNTCSGSSIPLTSIAWKSPSRWRRSCQRRGRIVRANKLDSRYVRPIVLRGYGDVGVNPFNCPVEVYMACWDWGRYLGEEAVRNGVDVGVSSWQRPAPNTLPQMAKAAGNYMNSALIRMEARQWICGSDRARRPFGTSARIGQKYYHPKHGIVITPPISTGQLRRNHPRHR